MTSPDNIKVRFGAIAQAAQDIRTTQAQIEQELADIRTAVGRLAVWDGASSDFYRTQQHEIDTAWQDLNLLLNKIATNTQQAGEGYEDAERRVGMMFRG
ncbi:WXG100 family type VII secretion target [Actinomycetospora lemnae]|uniref:ESAT-6-like protein n=1 Tax=Actinomycetospora lemnae TaxID=3019891 RepID=A0ABT5SUP2_9PSEU|nr:WXG100 family type VII secretion target [Actinomycetospora sp. DW7H6]MDD7966578.1 WXG100 family type VII secretion target [Actinomycetospora sp. DW7H6]